MVEFDMRKIGKTTGLLQITRAIVITHEHIHEQFQKYIDTLCTLVPKINW